MPNGNSDLSNYFPAGSAVIQRVDELRQSGNFTDNSLILTQREFDDAISRLESRLGKKAKLYFLYGLLIGIVGIVITIITSYLS